MQPMAMRPMTMRKTAEPLAAEPEPDSPALSVDLDLRCDGWHKLADMMHAQAQFVWHYLALPAAEVSLVLADNDFCAVLNRQYRDKAGPTNVLSFPARDFTRPASAQQLAAPGQTVLLGDIVLAYETVVDEATAQDKQLAHHACHLVTHGLLHLIGHDHDDAAAAEIMEKLETDILVARGMPDPYRTE